MKAKNLPKYSAIVSSLLLSATAFTAPSLAVSLNQNQEVKPASSESITTQNQSEYLVAQVSESCRQVSARSGLYVRQQPTVNSQAIGIINNGRNVTIANEGDNGWVPITAPLDGYVFANFLSPCDVATVPPPTSCRRVVAERGTSVWQAPSADTPSLGLVANGRRVTIESLGENGWVPISVPFKGYVQADNLGYCR
ncbi:SH3 domain-containing protein [Floridanema fluviatile]